MERDMQRDCYYMELALEQARLCAAAGEVPVGAVLVQGDRILAACGNGRERERDATAHAELAAIRQACAVLGGWRLPDCELFVTLEPCAMCAGAIINARLPAVIIGTHDPKAGAFGGIFDLNALPVNHHPAIVYGVLEEACAEVLRSFFRTRRLEGPRWKKRQ